MAQRYNRNKNKQRLRCRKGDCQAPELNKEMGSGVCQIPAWTNTVGV